MKYTLVVEIDEDSKPNPHHHFDLGGSKAIRFRKRSLTGVLKAIFFEPIVQVRVVTVRLDIVNDKGTVLESRSVKGLLIHPPILEV